MSFVESVFRLERFVHALRSTYALRFVRSHRSGRTVWAWFVHSRYSHLIRIVWITGFILLLSHYTACIWKSISESKTSDGDTFGEQYAASFYVALQFLQGQGVVTTTVSQNLFASFSVLLGSIVLAIVFGHVAVLVSNFNANSTNYQRKMEAVFAIMSKMQLPEPLRERIHQYYEHL